MILHLYLDLEDTIIAPVMDGWPQTLTINEDKVRQYIDTYRPDYVHIFSFAIWNAWELKAFNMFTRQQVERTFGVTLVHVPTVDDDIIPACCKEMGLHRSTVDFQEMSNFWGKQGAFKLYIRHHFKSGTPVEVRLLDDVVYNENFNWPDTNVTGQIVNVDQLEFSNAKSEGNGRTV